MYLLPLTFIAVLNFKTRIYIKSYNDNSLTSLLPISVIPPPKNPYRCCERHYEGYSRVDAHKAHTFIADNIYQTGDLMSMVERANLTVDACI
jgi:hypothetical protein